MLLELEVTETDDESLAGLELTDADDDPLFELELTETDDVPLSEVVATDNVSTVSELELTATTLFVTES